MKKAQNSIRGMIAASIALGVGMASPSVTHAAPPRIVTDDGAFVRITGNPMDGTIKFQYGWLHDTAASDAAGYWIGVYDITRSEYVWAVDTGARELPEQLFRNAHPTAELPDGDYKVVFFVRDTYQGPVTNIAEIEAPFSVDTSMM